MVSLPRVPRSACSVIPGLVAFAERVKVMLTFPSVTLLQQAFRYTYTADIVAILKEKGEKLFPAYMEIDRRLSSEDGGGFEKSKKYPMKERSEFREDLLEAKINVTEDPTEKAALEEYHAAVQMRQGRVKAKEREEQVRR
jgi:hypothetical protein